MPNLLERGGSHFEKHLMGDNEAFEFDREKPRQLLLFPGMLAPALELVPLVNHLRESTALDEWGITAVPLGLSMGPLKDLVEQANHYLQQHLPDLTGYDHLTLYGHSHGGRVVASLASRLQEEFPELRMTIITAGAPIVTRPSRLPWHKAIWNRSFSRSFRNWPKIRQPQPNDHVRYIGLYSPDDLVVDIEAATAGHNAELVEIPGFGHMDFIVPKKGGEALVKLLPSAK